MQSNSRLDGSDSKNRYEYLDFLRAPRMRYHNRFASMTNHSLVQLADLAVKMGVKVKMEVIRA